MKDSILTEVIALSERLSALGGEVSLEDLESYARLFDQLVESSELNNPDVQRGLETLLSNHSRVIDSALASLDDVRRDRIQLYKRLKSLSGYVSTFSHNHRKPQ